MVGDEALELWPTTLPLMFPLEVHLGLPSIVVIIGRGDRVVGVGKVELFFKPEGGVANCDDTLDLGVVVFRGMLLDPAEPGGMLKCRFPVPGLEAVEFKKLFRLLLAFVLGVNGSALFPSVGPMTTDDAGELLGVS